MSIKTVVALALGLVLALANSHAYALGAFSHMYVAQQALAQIKDPAIKKAIQDHLDAYYIGANFPDAGYVGGYLRYVPTDPSSGKNYGEAIHWDEFIDAYERVLHAKYKSPVLQAPMAFAFLMGIAAHRVSDDIWHNDVDVSHPKSKYYEFRTCDKAKSPFCYYGFISKVADLEAIPWNEAHDIADKGVDYVVIKKLKNNPILLQKAAFLKASSPSEKNVPLDILVEVFKAQLIQCKYGPFNITREDIRKDVAANQKITIDAIGTLAEHGALKVLENAHKMDWVENNYETDPDVGLNAIEVHVAHFIEKLGTRLLGPPMGRAPWVTCSAERGTCCVPQRTWVRFGAGGTDNINAPVGTYKMKDPVDIGIYCSKKVFGDPAPDAPGEVLTCQYLALPKGVKRDLCAFEGGVCKFPGQKSEIYYGLDYNSFHKSFTDSANCNTQTFGDPLPISKPDPEVRKLCWK